MPSKKIIKKVLPKIDEIDDNNSSDYDNDADDEDDNDCFNDTFLDDLNNDKYKDPDELKKEQKIADDEQKLIEKQQKSSDKIKSTSMKLRMDQYKLDKIHLGKSKPKAKFPPKQDDGLFSECPTEILGLDRRQLLARITQTKALFPEKLKTFKIKKNPTIEELQQYVEECDAIISTDCVEGFVTDSIVQCIRILEGVSSKTKFNVTGMADMLKDNTQFICLCKQLYLKHKIFANVPPEYQLIMLVSTTALICQQKNKQLTNMEIYLNGIPP